MRAALACAALIAGCNLDNPGFSPPEGALSYPMAIALSRETKPSHLFVANSNFDLRYNAGSIQTYDLNALDRLLQSGGCHALEANGVVLDGSVVTVPDGTRYGGMDAGVSPDGGARPDAGASGAISLPPDYGATSGFGNARGVLCDGRAPDERWALCCINAYEGGPRLPPITLPIDSFVTGMAVSPDGRHLYAPVASRSLLLDIDIKADGTLDCGVADGDRCTRGPGHRRADDDPEHEFPGTPSQLTVGRLADLGVPSNAQLSEDRTAESTYVAMAHDRGGISFYVANSDGRLVLESALTEVIPKGNLDVARPSAIATSTSENLLYVTAMYQAAIWRFGVRLDPDDAEGERGPRELLYQTSPLTVTGFSESRDLRDIVFDPNDDRRFYALVRGLQESIAVLERDAADPGIVRLVDAVRIGSGPSKLSLIDVAGRKYVLVACYDARAIFIVDAAERALVAMVRNLSGPYQLTFDSTRNLAYVADFRASVVRVVDLSWLADKRNPPPRIIATIGAPSFEGGLE